MKKNQRIYLVALGAIIGAYAYGLKGLVIGGFIGYLVGVILPWNL